MNFEAMLQAREANLGELYLESIRQARHLSVWFIIFIKSANHPKLPNCASCSQNIAKLLTCPNITNIQLDIKLKSFLTIFAFKFNQKNSLKYILRIYPVTLRLNITFNLGLHLIVKNVL